MKTILITGANSGIGKEMAAKCIKEGHQVVVIARESEKTQDTFKALLALSQGIKPILVTGDLASSSDIEIMVQGVKNSVNQIDVLINNAGVYSVKKRMSEDNIEMTLAVNVIAVVRLTEALLQSFGGFDIVNITSEMFKQGTTDIQSLVEGNRFKGGKVYSSSKKILMYYTLDLSRRLNKHLVVAIHPGVVSTNVFRDYPVWVGKLLRLFFESPEKAAGKIIEVVLDDHKQSGCYYNQNVKKKAIEAYLELAVFDDVIQMIKDQA